MFSSNAGSVRVSGNDEEIPTSSISSFFSAPAFLPNFLLPVLFPPLLVLVLFVESSSSFLEELVLSMSSI